MNVTCDEPMALGGGGGRAVSIWVEARQTEPSSSQFFGAPWCAAVVFRRNSRAVGGGCRAGLLSALPTVCQDRSLWYSKANSYHCIVLIICE